MRQGVTFFALAISTFCVLAPSVALAETRALVVGASGYPNLATSLHLSGPKNDTREFANTLVRLGVPAPNVTVLADGVSDLAPGILTPGPGAKAAILAGLDRLVDVSEPGDLVVFYFSGHGTQQPDLDGDEQGGSDEVFLPYDVGKSSQGGIENALVDDEMRVRIEKLLDKNVDFFGVIDACFSATGFRDIAGDDARARKVPPEVFGLPAVTEGLERSVLSFSEEPSAALRGRAAMFYAAQDNEEALEKVPPNGDADQIFGVFTYNLVRRMNETPALTYRNLHQAVMADIKRNTLMSTQTPEAEGDLLDEPVLGLSEAPARRQWSFFNGKLQGGELDGITAGSVIALFPDPTTPDDQAVAYGRVDEAGATRSVVTQIAYPCSDTNADAACANALDPAAYKKGRFARVVEAGVDFAISLSEPIRLNAADGHDYTAAEAALRQAVGASPLSARASFRRAGYDIAVALVDGKLAFATAAGAIDQNGPNSSPRLTLPADPAAAAAAVSDAVARIGKVLALQRLGQDPAKIGAVGFSTEMRVSRAKPAAVRDGACSDDRSDYEPAEKAGDAPIFAPCDIVSVVMKNAGKKPLDVTALFVGADFSITPVWPVDGHSSRILQAQDKTADVLQMAPQADAASDERLIFIAVPGLGRANVVFDNLGQEGLRAAPDDPPELAALRELVSIGVNDLSRSTTTTPSGIQEEMAIEVRPFHVRRGAGG